MTNSKLLKQYPLESLETYFERIEKLGYRVYATDDQCQIMDLNSLKLIIDADFHDDYHSNAAEAIEAFFYGKIRKKFL